MDRACIHEVGRRMRFMDVLGRNDRSELSQVEAAELLGIGERTFRRWRDRQQKLGEAGLSDRGLGPSPRRAPVKEIERMLVCIATSTAASRCSISTGSSASGTTTRWATR